MSAVHSLLRRQIRRHVESLEALSPEMRALIADVDAAYASFDDGRKMLERSLELSSAELLGLNAEARAELAASPDLVLRLNADDSVRSMRGPRLPGSAAEGSAAYLDIVGLLGEEPAKRLRLAASQARIESRVVRMDAFAIRALGGRTFEVRVVALPDRGEALAYFRDISDLTKAVDDLRQSERALHQAQKLEAIGRLAGGIAHDFNNILTVILGQSEMALATSSLAASDRERITQVVQAGERAAGLTRQLLMFSRLQPDAPQVVDPCRVVAGFEKMLRRVLGEHIVLLVVPAGDAVSIRIDPGQLEQVLMNLAVNARDAMPTGGRLTITVERILRERTPQSAVGAIAGESWVRIAVADSGTGMTGDVKQHLFEPFFTTKQPGKGTGLGLATSHGIVLKAGGQLLVDSEPGQGSTFEILLPAVETPRETQGAHEIEEPPVGRHETVLVVEDQAKVRELACEVLRGAGYQVLSAPDGGAAISQCYAHADRLDLLLTDMVMPAMGGRELAERVRRMRPETAVLFMTGYADEAALLDSDCPRVLPLLKPFVPSQLLRRIRDALTGNRCAQAGGPSRELCETACPLKLKAEVVEPGAHQ